MKILRELVLVIILITLAYWSMAYVLDLTVEQTHVMDPNG